MEQLVIDLNILVQMGKIEVEWKSQDMLKAVDVLYPAKLVIRIINVLLENDNEVF